MRRRKVRRTQTIPAASGGSQKVRFSQTRVGPSTVRVSGYDLIYDTDERVTDGAFCTIPCNPAYWSGTRVATIATSYAQYRPIKLEFDYYPQVSTMTSGNIVAGTLWNNNNGSNTTKQSLATSNGGKVFPIYQRSKSKIKLKTNLTKNLYGFQGYLDPDTNPFNFVAIAQHSNNIVPGYYMVKYVYDFKNPLGEGFDYATDIKTAGELTQQDVWDFTSGVLLTETNAASIGSIIWIKFAEETIQFFLGGSRIGMLADCIFKMFKCRPKTMAQIDNDYQQLAESNVLGELHFEFSNTENGSVTYNQFDIGDMHDQPIQLSDFVLFKDVMQGTPYNQTSGMFFKLDKIGAGRYNIAYVLTAQNPVEIQDDVYVLKSRQPVPNYSFENSNSSMVHLDIRGNAVAYTELGDFLPTELVIRPSTYPPNEYGWHLLRDIRLESSTSAMGIDPTKIIGGKVDRILIPRTGARASDLFNTEKSKIIS